MFWHKHHRRRRQCASGEMGAMGRFGKALSVTLLLLLSFPCFLASAATTVRPFLRGAVPGAGMNFHLLAVNFSVNFSEGFVTFFCEFLLITRLIYLFFGSGPKERRPIAFCYIFSEVEEVGVDCSSKRESNVALVSVLENMLTELFVVKPLVA